MGSPTALIQDIDYVVVVCDDKTYDPMIIHKRNELARKVGLIDIAFACPRKRR